MDESQIMQMLNSSEYLIGKRQTLRAIIESSATVSGVVIAGDSEQHIISSVVDLCRVKNIPCNVVSVKKEVLGKLAGIKVNCSMICLLK